MTETDPPGELKRDLGVAGATLLGLGSILGTGVFVSIGLAAGVAGPGVIVAVVLAAVIATFNGLSSAQLAAAHPVSGGTYEYGHILLNDSFGFAAGWLFLAAKSASAATAALGLAGYAQSALGSFGPVGSVEGGAALHVGLAAGSVVLLTVLVATGIRRSSRVNAVVVLLTIAALVAFVVSAVPAARLGLSQNVAFASLDPTEVLGATALMFVAFAGYGRVATLGEEVANPTVTIPAAIVSTLIISAILYIAVAFVGVAAVSAMGMSSATRQSAAPLEIVAAALGHPHVARFVALGAITAMLGVTLNLILGLSRVVLAMGRRGDLPAGLAVISRGSPTRAVIAVGVVITSLTLIGDIELTWSFSAFTVLVYYAITNLAAIRLPPSKRFLPRWISVLGLLSCLSVAFWVPPRVWIAGLLLLALGFAARFAFARMKRARVG